LAKKKTHEEYLKDVTLVHGNEIEVLEEYKNVRTKILHRHKCNYKWEALPSDILKGQSCPKCGGCMKKTHEEYVQEVFEKHNGEIEVLEHYKGNKNKILHKHSCDYEWEVSPNSILKGSGCPKCAGVAKKTHEEYSQEVLDKHNGEIEVVGEYKNDRTKILHRHSCGYEWEVLPNSILRGIICPECGRVKIENSQRKTHVQYVKEVLEVHSGNIEVIEGYVNNHTKILHWHKICNHKWKMRPLHTLKGHGCPICKEPKGEYKIANVLNKYGMCYEQQYTFDDCRNEYPLRFDFAVFDKDKNLQCLIEYQGRQHYVPIEHFGGIDAFLYQKKNDTIKQKYCRYKQIPLIRIPYWDFDEIESILIDKLYIK